MCGGNEKDLYDPRRYGALAVLNSSSSAAGDESVLSGQVVLFNEKDHKSPVATHVSFTPSGVGKYQGGLIFTIL